MANNRQSTPSQETVGQRLLGHAKFPRFCGTRSATSIYVACPGGATCICIGSSLHNLGIGGPNGFLKVPDCPTLAHADFRGNLQYISTGNVIHDNRVALFLMGYPHRERPTIMARGGVSDAEERPDLIEQQEDVDYHARIELGVIYHVEAFDWNRPRHITQRWTEAEFALAIERMESRRGSGIILSSGL